MRNHKSFTLIELLVVIAVIGLISSIVLVSLKGTRGKAGIAKGLKFSHSVNHVLGAYAVGIWNFDDLTNPTKDGSGHGNDGSIHGASFTADTPHRIVGAGQGKWALSFDGVNDYVNLGLPDSLKITDKITVEAWVNTHLAGNRAIVGSRATGYGWCLLQMNPTDLGFRVETTDGAVDIRGPRVKTNEWHHLVGIYDKDGGVNNYKIYLDGVLERQGTHTGAIVLPPVNRPFRIGNTHEAYGWWNGLIDEVRIYNEALTAAEIRKHYVEGLENHKNL